MIRITAAAMALAFSTTLALPASAGAQDLPPRGEQTPQVVETPAGEHLVVQGNTLWDLAQQFYGNPFDWRRIWEANRDRVENPDLIYPGQVLFIPDGEGNLVRVMVGPGDQGQPVADAEMEGEGMPRTIWYPMEENGRVYEQIRDLVPAVPEQVVEGAPFVVASADDGSAGRVTGFGGATETRITRESARRYDRLFVELDAPVAPGTRMQAYRLGPHVEGFGHVATPTAVIELQAMAGDRPVVEVVRVYGRLLEGDLLRPIDTYTPEPGVFPTRVSGGSSVTIAAYAGTENQLQSQGDYLFFERPSGAVIGDEYEVRLPGSGGAEGVFQVVSVRGDWATGRIINLQNPVFEPGVEATLSRKMPTG